MPFTFSPELARTIFYMSLTILIAVIVDSLSRTYVFRVPKHFDSRRARSYATFLRNIATAIIYTAAIYIILAELGINITPLLASAGVIGIIIGLGARALIEDLIGGLFLLSQDSIAIGDYIKIDDVEGHIESIGFRTLTVRAEDGSLCMIPNGQIKKVINYSRHRSRMLVDFPVKADQNIETVIKLCKKALADIQKDKEFADAILPESIVDGIQEFRPVGPMVIRVTVVTHPARRLEVARKYRYLVKREFEKNKILFG